MVTFQMFFLRGGGGWAGPKSDVTGTNNKTNDQLSANLYEKALLRSSLYKVKVLFQLW